MRIKSIRSKNSNMKYYTFLICKKTNSVQLAGNGWIFLTKCQGCNLTIIPVDEKEESHFIIKKVYANKNITDKEFNRIIKEIKDEI